MSFLPEAINESPSLAGFADAQDRKRQLMGSDITFLWPLSSVTYPPDTPINQTTGRPYDPTVQPTGSAQASATVRAGAFFKAINRGGASNAEVTTAIGHDEKTRLFLNLAESDGALIKGEVDTLNGVPFIGFGTQATEFLFHGSRFKIYAIKDDEIVLGYRRTLIYGAGIGADVDSGFSP